jgi:hypothetical protein
MDEKKLIDTTEERTNRVFLAHNEKLLIKAEEAGDIKKIELYRKNIKHYKKLLGIE